jgi:hypothetical protein
VIQKSRINEKAELNRALFVGLKYCEASGFGPKLQATSNKQQATSNKQQATSNKQQATSACDILSHDNMHCDNIDNLKIYKKVYNYRIN